MMLLWTAVWLELGEYTASPSVERKCRGIADSKVSRVSSQILYVQFKYLKNLFYNYIIVLHHYNSRERDRTIKINKTLKFYQIRTVI